MTVVIPGTADKTPLNRCNSLFRFPCKSILQPPWVHAAQDTRIYDWDLSKSVTPNEWEKALCAGSVTPTSLLLVSYLSFQTVLCWCCQRQQRVQVSRTGPNSPRIEQELYLHPEKKCLNSPRFLPGAWDFPTGLLQAAPSGMQLSNSLAEEDLTFCLACRNSLDPGLPRSDKFLRWHLLTESIFPRSAGLLWPASMFLSYLQNDQALFLGIFSSRLLKLSQLAFQ